MSREILENYLSETVETFQSYKTLAEKALAQTSDEEFFRKIDEESNSLAVIVKHIGGNLLSRWTYFLTTDGEKETRNRDEEFVAEKDSREEIEKLWNAGWSAAIDSLKSLKTEDLSKTVKIRGEEFTVTKAVTRSLAHTVSHIGEIIFLAKHLRSKDWKTLSIPRNQSAQFNQFLNEKKDKGNYLEAAEKFAQKNEK